MKNPFTIQVESYMGSIFISCLALFFIGIIFVAMKNFNSDVSIISSQTGEIRSISSTERELISVWVKDNNIQIPDGKGVRYVIQQYPDKPWLKY